MKNYRILKSLVFLVIVSITFISCDLFNLTGNKYSIGHFPTSPVNLKDFNTGFDEDSPQMWIEKYQYLNCAHCHEVVLVKTWTRMADGSIHEREVEWRESNNKHKLILAAGAECVLKQTDEFSNKERSFTCCIKDEGVSERKLSFVGDLQE